MIDIDPATATASILTVVVAAAAWINDRRKKNAQDSRQIKNDENAEQWQTSLLESNKEKDKQISELRQQKDDAWLLVSEARHDIFEAQSEAKLWRYKFEEEVKRTQILQADIERLKAKE